MTLHGSVERILALLQQLQPVVGEYDVVWHGRYYIPRCGDWHPSTFMLYRGRLFASLYIAPHWHGLSWLIGADAVDMERPFSAGTNSLGKQVWQEALEQIEQRLNAASRNPAAYNRRFERHLPLRCRTGKIQRALCWLKTAKRPPPLREVRKLERAMKRTERPLLVKDMTVARYLQVVGIAYDCGFKELRALSARQRYKRRADGRHGGMLDLPPRNPKAFSRWFKSRRWIGAHPWEIVFGHPHGIMISPRCTSEKNRWSYTLSVESERWYATAAHMALALVAHAVPFEFYNWEKVARALAGIDDVDVGRGLTQIDYNELMRARPDALSAIRWDPIPVAAPITPDQMARVLDQLSPDEGK